MKKIYLKRVLSAAMAFVIAFTAVGCGKKKAAEETTEIDHDVKQYVYSENDLNLGADVDYSNLSYMGRFSDKLYAAGTFYEETGTNLAVYIFDKDGSNVETINIKMVDNNNLSNISVGDDGSIYTLESSYGDMGGMGEIDLNNLFGEDVEIVDVEGGEATEEGAESADEDSEAETPETPDSPETPGEEDDTADIDDSDTEEDSGDSETADVIIGGDNSTDISGGDFDGNYTNDYYSSETYYIAKYDNSGKEQWRAELKNENSDSDSYFYVNSFLAIDGKGLFIADSNGIHLYSMSDGSLVKDIDTSEYADPGNGLTFTLYKTADNDVMAGFSPEDETLFYSIDADGGKLNVIENAAVPAYEYMAFAGVGYDLLLTNSDAVYGFNFGDAKPKMLMNFVDSDLNTYGLYQIVAATEESFLCQIPTDDGYLVAIMTKVDPSEVKDKQTITLGCNYIDYDVRSQVVKFNKENEDYRISILDYSSFDTEDDWSGGATKLNTDIVSGNIPDILVLDSDMPVDSYIAKGLFQDMSDYFSNDEEIGKTEYLDHMMEVFKNDGKMYKLIPSFYIETMATSSKNVGDANTWSIDELEKIVKDKNLEYKNIFGPLTRDDVFEMAMSLTGSQFIDWTKLTCSYNSDGFIHLLEFINEFPEEIPDDDYYVDTSSYWREGKAVASRFFLSGFTDFNYEEQGQYGEQISLVGFPSDNGSGAAIYPNLQLTMSATSKVKDGCWQFMRYFLTDEYQKTIDSSWPVSKAQIDRMAEQAKKKPTYTDENGKEVEYEDTWYVGETEVIINPMTDSDVNRVLSYIDTVDQIGNNNDSVIEIIREEAAAFFSGQKTAAEVADIIQSRVQIYVNEIS